MEFLASIHYILLPAHIVGVLITISIVVISDVYGSLWIIGKKEFLSKVLLHKLHISVWIGLIITSLAGFGMFLPYSEFLLTDPAFRIKVLFIAFLVINALVIKSHIHIPTVRSFASLARKERVPLLLRGIVSTTSWIGALIATQFIGL
ncbi:MAG: hypothetical protein ACI9VM_000318 [Candidatus Azotimanducaceae bacterium]|jgi:hypothetical protein